MASSTSSAETALQATTTASTSHSASNPTLTETEPGETAGGLGIDLGCSLTPYGSSDGDGDGDDDSIAPFPPYREPSDFELNLASTPPSGDGVLTHACEPLFDNTSDLLTPTLSSSTFADSDDPAIHCRLLLGSESDLTSPVSPASLTFPASSPAAAVTDATTAVMDTASLNPIGAGASANPPVKSPPAPPPPYWTHSRADGVSHAGRLAVPAGGGSGGNAAPIPAREWGISTAGGASPTQSPAADDHYLDPSAAAAGHNHPYVPTHRRDTSSSTIDFPANLITLQDNDASDELLGTPGLDWPAGNGDPYASPAMASASGAATLSAPADANRLIKSSNSNSSRSPCWARRVDIVDYVVINGGTASSGGGRRSGRGGGGGGFLPGLSSGNAHPRIGAFVVWTVRVETLDNLPHWPTSQGTATAAATPPGSSFCIYKRYSEFDALRRRLVASFPQARGGAVPPLPPKSMLHKFRPAFLEQRRLGLQYFLNCILLNPEFAGSPVLQEFLFS